MRSSWNHVFASALKEVAENRSLVISFHNPFLLSLRLRYSWLGEEIGLHLIWPL